jgi:hypothetical protein
VTLIGRRVEQANRNYCSLSKNLLLWRKNLGEGPAPFMLEYEQKRCFTYLWKQM